jgi:hypothetical protein
LEDAADPHYQSDALEENFDDNSNFDSKEDFADLCNGVSYGSNDEWMSGLELDDDEPTIFSLEPNNSNNTCRQVYTIIEETSEDLNSAGNPLVNPANLRRGSRYIASGTNKATITAREIFWLTAVEWTTIRAAINNTTNIPSNASRSVLMGYQYATSPKQATGASSKNDLSNGVLRLVHQACAELALATHLTPTQEGTQDVVPA